MGEQIRKKHNWIGESKKIDWSKSEFKEEKTKMSELLSEISMYLKMEDILNSENMIPIENVKELIDELQQKENIIKEVREYINNHLYMESTGGIQHPTFDGKMNRDTDGFEILEILDKENK